MAEKQVELTLDGFEQRLMVSGLMAFKRTLHWRGEPTQDVEQLILRVINAPTLIGNGKYHHSMHEYLCQEEER